MIKHFVMVWLCFYCKTYRKQVFECQRNIKYKAFPLFQALLDRASKNVSVCLDSFMHQLFPEFFCRVVLQLQQPPLHNTNISRVGTQRQTIGQHFERHGLQQNYLRLIIEKERLSAITEGLSQSFHPLMFWSLAKEQVFGQIW